MYNNLEWSYWVHLKKDSNITLFLPCEYFTPKSLIYHMAFSSVFWHSVSTSWLQLLVTIISEYWRLLFALGIFKEDLKFWFIFLLNYFFMKLPSALFEDTFGGVSRKKNTNPKHNPWLKLFQHYALMKDSEFYKVYFVKRFQICSLNYDWVIMQANLCIVNITNQYLNKVKFKYRKLFKITSLILPVSFASHWWCCFHKKFTPTVFRKWQSHANLIRISCIYDLKVDKTSKI